MRLNARNAPGRATAFLGMVALCGAPSRLALADQADRIGIEGRVLRYRATTVQPLGQPDRDRSSLDAGLASAGAGVGFGIALTDRLLLATRLTLAFHDWSYDEEEEPRLQLASVAVEASPEFLLLRGALRPYVGPLLGLDLGGFTSPHDRYGAMLLLFGARLGLYGFVNDGASFDPSVALAYATGRSSRSSLDEIAGFQVLVTFGVSAWFGNSEDEGDD